MAAILKRRLAGSKGRREEVARSQTERKQAAAIDVARLERVMNALERYKDEPLETLFRQLIAAQDGVRPEDVTLDYIRSQREKRFYPSTRYDTDSRYGGYDSRRLRSLSRNELDEVAAEVNSRLASILHDS